MNLKQFAIATFNLYNLNLPGRPIYTDRKGWTQAEYELKIAWTAHQLRLLKADIFGFQELWHGDALKQALELAGQSAEFDLLLPENAQGTQIVNAALVRKGLLVGAPEWISQFPPKFKLRSEGDDSQTPQIDVNISGFSRPVLHFAVQLRSKLPPVHVYVCHFKSKGPTRVFNEAWFRADKLAYAPHALALGSALSTIRRTAEAAALRMLLTEQPQYLVGDRLGGSDVALYTAQTLQEYRDTRDVYYTHVHQDMRESLDHILVSEQFYDHSRKRQWLFEGLVINNDHLNFDDHKADGTNDHGIIRASFSYKPIKTPA